MTLGYSMMLSALLLKTNRIYRIFFAKFKHELLDPDGKARFSGPKWQVNIMITNTSKNPPTMSLTTDLVVCLFV